MTRWTILLPLMLAVALPAGAGGPAVAPGEDQVETLFSVLVGFPSGEPVATEGSMLVTGTVIPVEADAITSEAERERVVERGLSFARAVDKLWLTFRLDPTRRIKRSRIDAVVVGREHELPEIPDGNVRITASLEGFNETAATYRVRFTEGDAVLADTTVSVDRGGRAVVGGMDGPDAPYIFVFVEPEPYTSGRLGAVRYQEGIGVSEPVALTKVSPRYPEQARRQKIQGEVVLYLLISDKGLVEDIDVLRSPDPALVEAAEEAVRGWTFEPARDAESQGVAVYYAITIRFRLE